MLENSNSRYPVYREDIDHIIGDPPSERRHAPDGGFRLQRTSYKAYPQADPGGFLYTGNQEYQRSV